MAERLDEATVRALRDVEMVDGSVEYRREDLIGVSPSAAEIASLAAEVLTHRERRCVWRADDDGVWHTACGHAWEYTTGGPKDNDQRFCGYCGGALVAVVGTWHCDHADCGEGAEVRINEDGCCAYCGADARWVEAQP